MAKGLPLLAELKKTYIKGRIFFVRGSADVPLDKNKDLYDIKRIRDPTKIETMIPTLRYLIESGAKIVLQPGWLGRPSGVQKELSTVSVYIYLQKRLKDEGLLKHEMLFAPSDLHGEIRSIGKNFDIVKERVSKLQEGQVLVLENPRFDPEYNKGDKNYAKTLAGFVECYVAEDFAHRHRPTSDIIVMPKYLPSYVGFHLEREIKYLKGVAQTLERKKRNPFVFILAGKKIETKPGIVSKMTVALHLLDRMTPQDKILVGGAVAYTFLVAKKYMDKISTGIEEVRKIEEKEIKHVVGESYMKWNQIHDQIMIAGKILLKAKKRGVEVLLPIDHVIRNKKTGEIKIDQKEIPLGWEGVDIGSETVKRFTEVIRSAGIVIMSGPVGMFDYPEVAKASNGSERIVREMERITKKGAVTISAGGESTFLVNKLGAKLTHASIGGGSTLEFIEKGTLVGIEALEKSKSLR